MPVLAIALSAKVALGALGVALLLIVALIGVCMYFVVKMFGMQSNTDPCALHVHADDAEITDFFDHV